MPISKNYFRKGDLIRSLAMIAVIFIHVLSNKQSAIASSSQFNWWVNNIIVIGLRWSVPIFIMLSGALIIRPHQTQNLKLFFKKRLTRVIIPLIFWVIIYYFWHLHRHTLVSLGNYLSQIFIFGLPYYHLYFIYIILGLYLVTPIINIFLKNTNRKQQIYSAILLMILAIISNFFDLWFRNGWENNLGNTISYFVPYLGYFILGYILREIKLNKKQINLAWAGYFVSVFIGSIATYFLMNQYGYTNRGLIFNDYLSITTVISALSLYLLINTIHLSNWQISQHKFIKNLAQMSLGVYLIHPIIIDIFEYNFQNNLSLKYSELIINFGFKIPFTIIISYLIIQIISKVPILKLSVGVK